jgi:hypothetical protein
MNVRGILQKKEQNKTTQVPSSAARRRIRVLTGLQLNRWKHARI